MEVLSIRGLFPKDNAEWLNWISQGKSQYLNKEKIQALIDKQRTNLAEVEYLDLDSVAKVIESFENPKVSEEKILYRESETGDVWNDHSLGLEERMVKLVEKGFDKFTPEEQGLWQHIKRAFERMLNNFFRTLHLPDDVRLGDAELRQMMRTKPKMSIQTRIGPTPVGMSDLIGDSSP
jgi:hypothetical protein